VTFDYSLVVTIAVTCYLWAPSTGDHFFKCGVISWPPHKGAFEFVCRTIKCFHSSLNVIVRPSVPLPTVALASLEMMSSCCNLRNSRWLHENRKKSYYV